MRRKKLANKITSILMAVMMLVSTPMSALATDAGYQDSEQQIEVQSVSEDSESMEENDGLTEESAEEEITSDEDITADEDVISEEMGGQYNTSEDEELILGDNEDSDEAVVTQEADGESVVEMSPAADAKVSVTISVKGELAKAKDDSTMAQKEVIVKDLDSNGKLTVDEALTAAHNAYYNGGAASGYGVAVSEQYGTTLTKLWGDTSGKFGYWDNDISCMSLDDEVKANDNLVAFVYQDATGYSDAYARFTKKEYTVEAGSPLTVEVEKAGYDASYNVVFSTYDGAVFTAYDSQLKALDKEAYTVNGSHVTFKNAGTYYLVVSGSDNVILVPAVAKVTVEESVDIPVTGISLSKTENSMYTGAIWVTLEAKVEPENATDKTITWSSSDPEIATVEESAGTVTITAKKPGTVTITAASGEVKADCVITVKKAPVISKLELYKSQEDYKAGKEPYTITPEFNGSVYEGYSLTSAVPDYLGNRLYAVATLSEETINSGFNEMVWFYNNWGGFNGANVRDSVAQYDIYSFKGTLALYCGVRTNQYKVAVKAYSTLQNLEVDGVMDQAFDRDVTSYHAYVDGSKKGVSITPTAYKNSKRYTIKINGETVTTGSSYTLPCNWDADNKMKVNIEVSASGKETSTYTIELEKYPTNDKPYFITQPQSADYIIGDTAKALSFIASANGKLSYQWYVNTADSNEGGTALKGETAAEYTPSTEKDGTFYYYCVVTNTEKEADNTAASDVARITVDQDPTPVATLTNIGSEMPKDGYEYAWDTGFVYNVDETAQPLTVQATSKVEGGTWEYSWIWLRKGIYEPDLWTGTGDNTESFVPPTTRTLASDTGRFYGCRVTYIFKGKKYVTYATTGQKLTIGEGEDAKTDDVKGVYVFIKADPSAPVIYTQPQEAAYLAGDPAKKLTVSASSKEAGTLSYQWYYNTVDSTEGGNLIPDATVYNYLPSTENDAGTRYYYCVVTNTLQGKTASTASATAKIEVRSAESLVGEKLSGTGTKGDPYQIKDAQNYKDVAELVARGFSFDGKYLQQQENITLPKDWTPIGVTKDGTDKIKNGTNLNAFSGTLDGNGKVITIPENGLPLFGYVNGATIKNLKIYGTKIAGYGLVNNLYGVGLSGSSVVIDGVTLMSGSSTLKSGLVGAEIGSENPFAGCSAAYVATIKNCTIEKNVIIGYDKNQSMIGSIAGRMQGSVENCVSYATVYGKDYVGGIIGTRDNALGLCSVSRCSFEGIVEATGTHAGGIGGGGYENQTAPNGAKIAITNCSASGAVSGADKVGGILGGDTYVAQSWGSYSFKGNSFTGKVTATAGTYVGGIIGFYDSLNKYDGIENNYYTSDCGAEKAIGFVQYVDTSSTTHETASGSIYFSTEKGVDGCPEVGGCNWKAQHNRTDDPLGADASALADTDGVRVYVEKLEISGEYKTEYYMGQTFDLSGMTFTATWSDERVENPTAEEVQVAGFDTNKKGWQTVTISYKEASATVRVRVKTSIKVTFSLLGDKKHDSDKDGEIHTLADNNLTVWVQETGYYVDPDATVYDVMQEAAEDYGFEMIADNDNQYHTIYVKGITMNGMTLSEMDNGPRSGWMDVINGIHPDVGVSEQTLNDGDVIIFHYTDDYTREESKMYDQQVADNAIAAINALVGTDKLTLADKAAVEAARAEYNQLTDAQKALVPAEILKKLTDAESRIAELEKHVGSDTPSHVHAYGEWTKISDATVFAPEKQERTCSCGAKETRDYGSALKATIKVNATTVPLKVKQKTSAFKVTGLANGDSIQSYKSSNTKIFTVTKSGVLKAGKKSGKATLTITLASGLQKKVTVKVQKKTVTTSKITGLQKKVTLKKGKKLTLKPSRTPITSTQKFTYKSSNKKIATVSSKGVIKGKKTGKAKITVKSGKKKYTVTVIVTK